MAAMLVAAAAELRSARRATVGVTGERPEAAMAPLSSQALQVRRATVGVVAERPAVVVPVARRGSVAVGLQAERGMAARPRRGSELSELALGRSESMASRRLSFEVPQTPDFSLPREAWGAPLAEPPALALIAQALGRMRTSTSLSRTSRPRTSFEMPQTPEEAWCEEPLAAPPLAPRPAQLLHGQPGPQPQHAVARIAYPLPAQNYVLASTPVQAVPPAPPAPVPMHCFAYHGYPAARPAVVAASHAGVPVPPLRAAPLQAAPRQVGPRQPGAPQSSASTIMLRNIPVTFDRERVLADIDARGFRSLYDFFYLPIDFQTGNNVGYAFINFPQDADGARFRATYQGARLSKERSNKVCAVCDATKQGLDENVDHYRNSPVMGMEERYHPLIFHNGIRQPFPGPTKPLKQVRQRATRAMG